MTVETGITFADVALLRDLTLPLSALNALRDKCKLNGETGSDTLFFDDSNIVFHVDSIKSGSEVIGYRITSIDLGGDEADWKGLFLGNDPDKTARFFKNQRLPSVVLEKELSGVLCVLSQTKGEVHFNFFVDSSCRALRMIWKEGKCELVNLFSLTTFHSPR